jgi:hypothetical protein
MITNKPSDLTDIGSFWKKTKNGKSFLSGEVKIGDRKFTAFIFPNQKKKDTHPDYRLTLAELDADLVPPAFVPNGGAAAAPAPSSKAATPKTADIDDTDIPF